MQLSSTDFLKSSLLELFNDNKGRDVEMDRGSNRQQAVSA
jgi:hypothetical protein